MINDKYNAAFLYARKGVFQSRKLYFMKCDAHEFRERMVWDIRYPLPMTAPLSKPQPIQ